MQRRARDEALPWSPSCCLGSGKPAAWPSGTWPPTLLPRANFRGFACAVGS